MGRVRAARGPGARRRPSQRTLSVRGRHTCQLAQVVVPALTSGESAARAAQVAKRVVIIGGVAGGMSTATRLRRLDATAGITVLERSGHVSFANCGLPY